MPRVLRARASSSWRSPGRVAALRWLDLWEHFERRLDAARWWRPGARSARSSSWPSSSPASSSRDPRCCWSRSAARSSGPAAASRTRGSPPCSAPPRPSCWCATPPRAGRSGRCAERFPRLRALDDRLERHGVATVVLLRLLLFLAPPLNWALGREPRARARLRARDGDRDPPGHRPDRRPRRSHHRRRDRRASCSSWDVLGARPRSWRCSSSCGVVVGPPAARRVTPGTRRPPGGQADGRPAGEHARGRTRPRMAASEPLGAETEQPGQRGARAPPAGVPAARCSRSVTPPPRLASRAPVGVDDQRHVGPARRRAAEQPREERLARRRRRAGRRRAPPRRCPWRGRRPRTASW